MSFEQLASASLLSIALPLVSASAQVALSGAADPLYSWRAIAITTSAQVDRRITTARTFPIATFTANTQWSRTTDTASIGFAAHSSPFARDISGAPLLRAALTHVAHDVSLHLGLTAHAARIPGRDPRDEASNTIVDLTTGRVTHLPGDIHDYLRTSPAGLTYLALDSSVANTGPAKPGEFHIRRWSDAEGGITLPAGRARVQILVGRRAPIDTVRARTWAEMRARVALDESFALEAAAGARPDEFDLGAPRRFVSAAARFSPPFAHRPDRSDIAPGFSILSLSDRRYRISYREQLATTVELSADFTEWRPVRLDNVGGGRWEMTAELPPGIHHVNLRVDGGAWLAPPGLPSVRDDFSGAVGVLVVR